MNTENIMIIVVVLAGLAAFYMFMKAKKGLGSYTDSLAPDPQKNPKDTVDPKYLA